MVVVHDDADDIPAVSSDDADDILAVSRRPDAETLATLDVLRII